MTGTVLFGDDGSPSADLAWMWIDAQRWSDWRIDVLTAHPDREIGDAAPQEWQPPRPRVCSDPSVTVRHMLSHVDSRVAFLQHPAKDLIVIGPRGRGLLKAMHLGSTAEWLMHDPPAPLVIARHGRPVHNVLVCTDGSPGAQAAVAALAGMPWLPDVAVTVVSVKQAGLDPEQAAAQGAALLQGRAGSVKELAVGPTEFDVFYHVRDIILSVVRETDPDLLVQGTTGLSSWAALRAGSIATSLAAHAPCSVMMAHRPS